jgi:hypothetical protein
MSAPFVRHPIGWTVVVALWLINTGAVLWRSRKAATLGDRLGFLIAAAMPASVALAIVCWLIWPGWFP